MQSFESNTLVSGWASKYGSPTARIPISEVSDALFLVESFFGLDLLDSSQKGSLKLFCEVNSDLNVSLEDVCLLAERLYRNHDLRRSVSDLELSTENIITTLQDKHERIETIMSKKSTGSLQSMGLAVELPVEPRLKEFHQESLKELENMKKLDRSARKGMMEVAILKEQVAHLVSELEAVKKKVGVIGEAEPESDSDVSENYSFTSSFCESISKALQYKEIMAHLDQIQESARKVSGIERSDSEEELPNSGEIPKNFESYRGRGAISVSNISLDSLDLNIPSNKRFESFKTEYSAKEKRPTKPIYIAKNSDLSLNAEADDEGCSSINMSHSCSSISIGDSPVKVLYRNGEGTIEDETFLRKKPSFENSHSHDTGPIQLSTPKMFDIAEEDLKTITKASVQKNDVLDNYKGVGGCPGIQVELKAEKIDFERNFENVYEDLTLSQRFYGFLAYVFGFISVFIIEWSTYISEELERKAKPKIKKE